MLTLFKIAVAAFVAIFIANLAVTVIEKLTGGDRE